MNVDITRLRQNLDGRVRQTLQFDGFRESAVLVPILAEPDRPDSLLFTVRRDDLPTHAGQISFPGGAHDATVHAVDDVTGASPDATQPTVPTTPTSTLEVSK